MKRGVTLFLIIALAIIVNAEAWHNELTAGVNINLDNYSDNWAGTEVSNIAWVFNINAIAEKQVTKIFNTKNTAKLSLGQTMNKDNVTDTWMDPNKSTDIIDIESIERLTMGWFADPFAGVRMESSFIDGSDTAQTFYVNPIRLTESFGIARILFKSENSQLSVRGGAAIRQLIDYSAADSLGDLYTDIINDGGIELIGDYNTPLLDGAVLYTAKVTLYKALFNSQSDILAGTPQENNWKAVDVYFDNILSAKITDFININMNVQILYDKEIIDDIRHKENLSIGINYRFL